MENVIFTTALISALKRKDFKMVIQELMIQDGNEEGGAFIMNTTKLTALALDKALALKNVEIEEETEVELTEEPTLNEDEVEHKEPETGGIEEHEAIVKAIKKGKGKKALKLIKKAIEGGARGSEIKKLKAEAKAL